MNKVIISLAPILAGTPVDAKVLAADVEKSVRAGAAMCHLHCRNELGELTPDISYMAECFDEILKRTDTIVQVSTGGISDMTIQERCNPLKYGKTEMASLNGGSTNLGEAIYRNSFEDIRYCSKKVYEKSILPEIEVFDIGMIHNMNIIEKEQPFLKPRIFNLVFGHKGGMQPTIEMLAAFRSFVPSDAIWGVTHYGRENWSFLAACIASGASIVRIGFEDSDYLGVAKKADYNYQLVERLVYLIHAMGLEVATVDEAREMLKIEKR